MEVSLPTANRLLNPGEVILVTSKHEDKVNIITIAWQSPVSHTPPLLCISVGKTRYSHDLIRLSKEFVVNIPTVDILPQVVKCGKVSGKTIDKFAITGLTLINSSEVYPPRIKECIGWLECRLANQFSCGDHTLFIGEVLLAEAKEEFFDKHWLVNHSKLIHHLGGNFYTLPSLAIEQG